MRMYDLITKKKLGEELTSEEIHEMIDSYVDGMIPDYQMSAFLMAVCLRGMNEAETVSLTDAIAHSGGEINLTEFGNLSVDKHSTGGVGDKTSLIVCPLAASLGLKVAKMSGRGLGHTGGTVDKLESFTGYQTEPAPEDFFDLVRKVGVAIVGQTGDLAPADKKLYALRDVTATVDCIPLIASSIMGKKLAAGAKNIVLDVKYGSGAFMSTPEAAEELAKTMVRIGTLCGRKVSALITDMDRPLGQAVGNIIEAKEAIEVLRGRGPEDLREIALALVAQMAHLAMNIPVEEAREKAEAALNSGAAFAKFKEWIAAQGGDISPIDDPSKFKASCFRREILSPRSGTISHMNTEQIGNCAVVLGAGREKKEDVIDPSAGILLKKKTGDTVQKDEVLAVLYSDEQEKLYQAEEMFLAALSFSDTAIAKKSLILKTIESD